MTIAKKPDEDMRYFSVEEFQQRFDELVGCVEQGEIIAITEGDQRISVLVPWNWWTGYVSIKEIAKNSKSRSVDNNNSQPQRS